MKLALAILTLCFAVTGAAKEGFFNETTLPAAHRPANLKRAVRATFRVSGRDARPCSGSFITDDGIFVTALHCVSPCLVRHQLVKRLSAPGADFIVTDAAVTASAIGKGAACENLFLEDSDFTSPKIVYLGRGFLEREKANSPDMRKLFDQNLEDLAVLKFETRKPVTCVPLAADSLRVSDPVWGIGYPLPVHRANGISAGYHQDLSKLSAHKPFEFEYVTWGVTGEGLNDSFHSSLYDPKRYFAADIEGTDGMSGGPLLNSTGALVGIYTHRFGGAGDGDDSPPYRDFSVVASGANQIEAALSDRKDVVNRLCR